MTASRCQSRCRQKVQRPIFMRNVARMTAAQPKIGGCGEFHPFLRQGTIRYFEPVAFFWYSAAISGFRTSRRLMVLV